MSADRTVGVVVGRFQVPKLHEAHLEVLKLAGLAHRKLLIFVGTSPVIGTRVNPLSFEARRQMIINSTYYSLMWEGTPSVTILPIADHPSDIEWSKNLDASIKAAIDPFETPVLYGGRDSFLQAYHGVYERKELGELPGHPGTTLREKAGAVVVNSQDWREGAIWSAYNRFPCVHPCVDVAVLRPDYGDAREPHVLLARKPNEADWRFIGGFADPASKSYEADALRELHEEAGLISVGPMQYVGSLLIEDWRYRKGVDKIKTMVFTTDYVFGPIKAGDDVEEVDWVPWKLVGSRKRLLVPEHNRIKELISAIKPHLND